MTACVAGLGALSVAAAGVVPAGTITGTVEGHQGPLAGARIEVRLSGQAVDLPSTGADGRFAFDVETVFPDPEIRDARAIALIVTHDAASHPRSDVIHAGTRGVFAAEDLVIVLETTSAGLLTEEERGLVAEHASPDGHTIFLLPYEGDATSDDIDRVLRWQLHEQINTAFRELGQTFVPTVGLSAIALPVGGTDAERIRVRGDSLNALAMVSGLRTTSDTQVDLRSQFLIVPGLEDLRLPVVFVRDRLEVGGAPALDAVDRLSETWSQAAALAVGVRALREAGQDVERLREVRAFLAAQREALTSDAGFLADHLGRLIARIDAETDP